MMVDYSVDNDLAHILSHTTPLWEELRGKHLLLTGGTGFFGSWLVSSFLHANQILGLNSTITVLSRNPEKFFLKMPHLKHRKELDFIIGDVRYFDCADRDFTHIIHAATESSSNLNGENPLEMLDTIVSGTKNVLQFAQINPVEKFLYVSSGAVYGKQPPELSHIPETYLGGPNQLLPFSAYAEGKRTAELLCSIYSNLNVKIARCFAFVGPYLSLSAHFAVGDFIADAISGKPIIVNGDGTPYRSYLYGADMAIWLWTILFSGKIGEAYNVGSGNPVQISELAHLIAKKVTPSPKVEISIERNPSIPCARYIPDVGKAFRDLGLYDFIPLEPAIERMIAWNRAELQKSKNSVPAQAG
jgi:nucleoside-diphosphate-sugar epimerase